MSVNNSPSWQAEIKSRQLYSLRAHGGSKDSFLKLISPLAICNRSIVHSSGLRCWGILLKWKQYRKGSYTEPSLLLLLLSRFSRVRLFATPWAAAHQASLSITNSQNLLNSCPSGWWCHPTLYFNPFLIPFSRSTKVLILFEVYSRLRHNLILMLFVKLFLIISFHGDILLC